MYTSDTYMNVNKLVSAVYSCNMFRGHAVVGHDDSQCTILNFIVMYFNHKCILLYTCMYNYQKKKKI